MLSRQSERIRRCLELAEQANIKADHATDPVAKADFLKIRDRWLKLAHGFETVDRLDHYLATLPEEPHCGACNVRMRLVRVEQLNKGRVGKRYRCITCNAETTQVAFK
jgi:hypothetical protein